MPLFEHTYADKTKDSQESAGLDLPAHQVLQLLGPVLQVVISPTPQYLNAREQRGGEPIQPKAGLALIDTGASVTAVDEGVCRDLGLQPTDRIGISHAGGVSEHLCYPVQILFPGTPLPPIIDARVVSVRLHEGKQPILLLLGRDVLSTLRLVYNGLEGRIEVAF